MRGSTVIPRSGFTRTSVGNMFTQRLQCSTSSSPSTSLAAGFFKVKINAKEMFPFPTRAFSAEEGDNLETIVRNVQEKQSGTTLNDIVEWGAAGSPIATEYGGLQLSETAHSVSLEELARHAPTSAFTSLLPHASACSYLIKSFANSNVRARYLAGMSDASMKMSWAVYEPHAADDISMNTTVAKANGDGSYTLHGTKVVAFAADATHFLVLARAPTQSVGPDGPVMVDKATFFVVERAGKGVIVTPTHIPSHRSTVAFDGAVAHDIIGAVGEGHVQYMVTLHSTHHLISAAIMGVLKRMLSIATKVGKSTSASSSLIPAAISSSAVEIYGLESVLYALTANLDVPVGDSLIEATICAALISRSAQSIGQRIATAVQHSSPSELSEMTTAQSDLNMLLSLTENSEFLYCVAASCGVEDFGLYFQKASTLETMQNRALRGLGFRDSLPNGIASSWPEAKKIEEGVLKFGAAVEHVFIRQNVRLRHATLTLNRIGEAAALLYASTACVARIQMAEKKGAAGSSKKMASQFISFAMSRLDELCDECRNSGKTADEAFKRIAMECAEEATRLAGGLLPPPPPTPVAEAKKSNAAETKPAAPEQTASTAESSQ